MHRCPLALIMFCIVFEFHAASSQHLFGEHMHWALNNHAPILFSLMTDPFLCPTFRLCQSLTTSPLSRGSLTMHRPPVRSPGRPVADWQTHEESRRWKNSLQSRRVSITDRAAGRTDQPRVRRRRGGLSEREKTCRVERWTLDT